ncbi:Rieske (2Fe-2S) protein [Variovorax sp. J22R133]|uniref:QcrA and Rieske domain-containing protein n=1 Tax=Variovorax brevis TaxID=3053503 RepID=UPI00257718D4|nr:Rieske (2Fe-2S) protein [Variovorax sp. J22R133]MDM0117777.1 Rieske (2Fe-2S) protein [Variovorax sp. J22R133]
MTETTMKDPFPEATLPCCACAGADPGRRLALKAVAGAAFAASTGLVWADGDGPKAGDQLVQVDDEGKKPLASADIKVGEKPVIVYPYDPKAKALRDSTRLNRILLVKLDPSSLDAATAARAADGIVAYSAFCTHQGCDVSSWVAADKSLLCFCHFSKFAPHQEAAVTAGPAPRPLPALPIRVDGGTLVVAGSFNAPPGKAV